MKPIKIEFQAFGPYAGYESVDFEDISSKGLFLICGKTGTGKTMILDAMTYALYGKSSGNGRNDFEAMRCTNAEFKDTTFVKFEFENNGEYYIFERRLERKKKNLSASYNVMKRNEQGSWEPLFENAKEKQVNAKAVDIIGLEYDQFRQVIVLPQGQFEKLLTSSSDEKEKILTSIFGEDKWQAIAEKLYNQVVERKDSLKRKKEKIDNSLGEEQCGNMAQLYLLIEGKQKELSELEEGYKTADYDKIINTQQGLLAVAKRFDDLHKAEDNLKRLEEESSSRDTWNKEIEDGLRAEKVREFINEVTSCQKTLDKRRKEEQEVRDKEQQLKISAEQTAVQLKEHMDMEPDIELKKKQKIQYEEKRSDYKGIAVIKEDVEQIRQKEKNAVEEENNAGDIYRAFGPEIIKLQQEYEGLNSEHSSMLETYLAGITGELAGQLVDGQPCPVCGSLEHPHKATASENSVTKQEVDKKKKAADKVYKTLQTTMDKQSEAKKVHETRLEEVHKLHEKLSSLETDLKRMQKNMVEGIDSSEELEKVILQLDESIREYADKKLQLEEDEKISRETYTAAKAKLEPAAKETKEAGVKLEAAEETLKQRLAEYGFETEESAKTLLKKEGEILDLQKKVSDYEARVKAARENLKQLQEELANQNEPDIEECNSKLTEASNGKTDYAKRQGILDAELKRLKNKAENLEALGTGIEEALNEAEDDYTFAKTLRGDTGTGLQRYVLGIMFSSVVAAANKMLEMVHGGRYHLYRSDDKTKGSNKRGLELKVYDKNSSEHEGRFVGTLSGGEKFLASLALSIGMSTVAQKSGIKIDALFIDEGFGSLDEESIGDAMNILNSIQEAHGMVGIISHVQLLQDRIPTKLKVEETENGSHIVQTIG